MKWGRRGQHPVRIRHHFFSLSFVLLVEVRSSTKGKRGSASSWRYETNSPHQRFRTTEGRAQGMACQREDILKVAAHFGLAWYAICCSLQRRQGKHDNTGLRYYIPIHRSVHCHLGLFHASRAPRNDFGKEWKRL